MPFALKRVRRRTFALILIAAFVFGFVISQDDPYAWLPDGGAHVLLDVLGACEQCDDLQTIMTTDRTVDEWRAYFGDRGISSDESEAMDERDLNLLISYLANVAPVESAEDLPSTLEDATVNALPADGRLLTLQFCMTCHGIQVSVTLDWKLERWQSHLGGSTHGTLGLADAEMQMIANYLANTVVERDQIPEDQIGPPATQ